MAGMSKVLVWFDGGCPLCRREIALMRLLNRGRAIAFVDVALPGVDVALPGVDVAWIGTACPVDRAALLARFHALEDGQLRSGAAAFAAMWRAIPVLRPLGLAARNPHVLAVLAVLEALYGRFLRLRPTLQRLARWLDRPARA